VWVANDDAQTELLTYTNRGTCILTTFFALWAVLLAAALFFNYAIHSCDPPDDD
jgi:hypothetical protein